jgi:hypothetical protein
MCNLFLKRVQAIQVIKFTRRILIINLKKNGILSFNCIPTYVALILIAETLDSIIAQTYASGVPCGR